jgi:hypothetical protein
MFVLEYLGFDSIIELPEVNKIKEQLKKLNNKHDIINRINQLDKELNFDQDIDRFIWTKKNDDEEEERLRKAKSKTNKKSIATKKLEMQNEPPNLVFMPKQINVSKSFEETFEKIEKYIEKVKRHELTDHRDENYKNFKIIRNKSSERPKSFLSQLMETNNSDDENKDNDDNDTEEDSDKNKSTIPNNKQTKNVTPSSSSSKQQEFNTKSSHTLLSQQIDVILEEPE